MNSTKKNVIIISIILLVVLIITYSNHFDNGFHFDDSHTIVNNVHITNINNIPQFFVDPQMFSSRPDHWGLRPIVSSSLAIDYWVGNGLNPFYFHLSTFIWYIILCFLLFAFYKRIYVKSINHKYISYIALFGTAWYVLHVVNAETINYVISRSDVLSTLCIVLSVVVFIIFSKLRKWYLYIIPASIGVFAKETMVVIPILLFFYILLFEEEMSVRELFRIKNFGLIFKTFLKLLPLTLVILILQLYTLSKAGSISGFSNPPLYYLITQPFVWVHYFLSLFLPFNLSADSDWTVITNVFDDRVTIGFIFVAFLVYTIIKMSDRLQTKPIAFGLIWFVASLLPTSIAPLAEVTNDHRMFLPFVGLIMTVVYSAGLLVIKYEKEIEANKKYSIFLVTFLFVFLSSYAFGTYQRNKVWQNDETLWYDVTVKSPNNGRGLMNYGLTQMAKGNYEEAEKYFKKALILNPYYSTLYINLGILQEATRRPKEAEESFLKAISLQPTNDQCYFYYAKYLFNSKNDIKNAQINVEKALEISSDNFQSRYLLMNIYQKNEDWGALEKLANESLLILPNDATSLRYLNISKDKKSKIDLAIEDINTQPTAEKYLNLSLLYYNKQLYDQCIQTCYEALKLKPDYYQAYNNICSAYNLLGEYEKAIEACERSIAINPNFELSKNNLRLAKNKITSAL